MNSGSEKPGWVQDGNSFNPNDIKEVMSDMIKNPGNYLKVVVDLSEWR